MKDIPVYTKSDDSMFTHWTETLYLCCDENKEMYLKILNSGDFGCGETFRSLGTTSIGVLYSQLQQLCSEKNWEIDDVIESVPSVELPLISQQLELERRRLVAERDAEDKMSLLVAKVSLGAIYSKNSLNQMDLRIMDDTIQSYVFDYLKMNNRLPTGSHLVNGTEVTFPDQK